MNLTELCKETEKTPQVITDMLNFIRENGFHAEGVFRISGDLGQVRRLRAEINTGKFQNFQSDESVHKFDTKTFSPKFL